MTERRKKTGRGALLPFDKALARVLDRVTWRLAPESVEVKKAMGRVLAEEVTAKHNIPPFDKSAMDGYAVRALDTKGASGREPAVLKVIEDLPAGRSPKRRVRKEEAARIMTGAPLPGGADAVVMVEDTGPGANKGEVKIYRSVERGQNVGDRGEDVKKGERVLKSGTGIGPAQMGMLAALGRDRVRVSRKPKVYVVSTGNEVQVPGRALDKGQIYDANGYSLLGLALARGCEARFLGIARDRPGELKKKIAAAKDADVVVMTGGVSVGDYDIVTDLLRSLGIREVFYKVRIQPGMPTFAGIKSRRLFFGLPGNPVSCMVCFELFVRPALDRMTGKEPPGMTRGRAVMASDFKVKPGRRKFLRARVVGQGPQLRVRAYRDQKSGVLRSMLEADLLVDLPEDAERIKAGSLVDIWWLGED